MNFLTKTLLRLTLCAAITLAASAVYGQTNNDAAGKNEIGIWGGYSPDSTTAFKAFGRTEDARFGIAAVRYARRFNNGDTVNLKYTIDGVPLAVLSDSTFRFVQTGNTFQAQRRRETYYGFGVAPLGLQVNFRPRKKLQPFACGSGGLLYFNKTLQDGLGKRFNFTADIGGGLEIKLKENRALSVGYKYYHISNGKRGIINPGIDNNIFYVGYSFIH